MDAGELHALLTWSVQRDERESEVAVGKRASELATCRDEVCKSIFSMRHFVDAIVQRVVGRLCRLTKSGVEIVGSARIEIQIPSNVLVYLLCFWHCSALEAHPRSPQTILV